MRKPEPSSLELITAAQSIREESQSLLEGVRTASTGNPSLLPELLGHETRFDSVDTRIEELVGQLRGELEEEQKNGTKAELDAQARAAEVASSMRPRVVEAFALIRATIAQAALKGVVRVESVSDPRLSGPVMMSTGQLRGRSDVLDDSGLAITFNQDWRWNIHVVPGHVQSVPHLAEGRKGPDLSYPTLRVIEDATTLATVGFDAKTADLTISARDATSRFAQKLDGLKREYQQDELVAHAILELLQDAKDRRSTS